MILKEIFTLNTITMDENTQVSTLTAITSIQTDIDIQNLCAFIKQNELSMEQNVANNTSNIGVIRHPISKDKTLKEFKNQVQLHLPLQGNNNKLRQVKIKVFNNGRLHITGAQSLNMVRNILSIVNEFLCKSKVIDKPFDEDIANKNVEIVMINMTIDAKFKINQKVFKDILINKYNIYAEFSPKTYAGVNAHFEVDGIKRASFLIFQSGKINIAGAKGLFHLTGAKAFIENILTNQRKFIELT